MVINVPNNIDLKEIYIDIHCIGRNPEGEGIIFEVKSKSENYVLFNGVIDEYFDNQLLSRFIEKKLDFICWTHPHDDHTTGIKDAIKRFANKETKIFVPQGINAVKKYMTPLCEETYKMIKNINRKGKKSLGEYVELNQYSFPINNIYEDTYKNKLNIKMRSLLPISKIANNDGMNTYPNMNDFSICLLVSINNANFLFTGDIYNNIINYINFYPNEKENIIYYKIPHHGSIESEGLLKHINNINDDENKIAVTTIYAKNGTNFTPNNLLINRYLNKGLTLYCTNKNYIEPKKEYKEYGIVSTRIAMNSQEDTSLEWDIICEGDADIVEYKKIQNKFEFFAND